MGGYEDPVPAGSEPSVKYHPLCVKVLTPFRESGRGTLSDGQFDWGGFLPKSNGGVQRYPQGGRLSPVERKGRRVLDCETNASSRLETGT